MSETPIVLKDSYSLLIRLCKLVSKLPKSSKYSLGEKIKTHAFNMVAEISLATKALGFEEKIEHLKQTKKDIELVLVALHICNDIGDIPHEEYKNFNNELTTIFNQIAKRETFCTNKLKEQNNLLQ